MGTNYYLTTKPPCECCGRPYDRMHIGKSSAGWCFSLHVDPENGINDLPDWVALWSQPGAYIQDEYGDVIPPEEMMSTITNRRWKAPPASARTLAENDAVRGPVGLMRHAIGRHCVGHGEGTWDLIPGEFC